DPCGPGVDAAQHSTHAMAEYVHAGAGEVLLPERCAIGPDLIRQDVCVAAEVSGVWVRRTEDLYACLGDPERPFETGKRLRTIRPYAVHHDEWRAYNDHLDALRDSRPAFRCEHRMHIDNPLNPDRI